MATVQAALAHNAAGLRRSALSGAPLAQSARLAVERRRPLRVCAKVREIFMPALSSTMTEGKIVSWSKSEGDKLSKGESVVVVESDKADMDVETFYDGILAAILVNEGEVAPVGAAIGLLAESEEEVEAAKAQAASASAAAPAAAPPPPPPAPAPVAPAPVVAAAPPAPPPPSPAAPGKLVASPHAQKLAKQLKVALDTVTGTGPYGRITPADVEKAAGKAPTPSGPALLSGPLPSAAPTSAQSNGAVPAAPAAPAPAAAPAAPAPIPANTPFNGMQQAVAKNMVASLSVPVIHIGYTVTTDALDALYKKLKPKGVTITVLLAKAVALALAKHPVMNAACHDGASFTYNNNINIAVAVALDGGGLITPVLQDADKVDVYTLSAKWKDLVARARKKQLNPNEYLSGTFTLSNLGMFGVDRFDAVVQKGQGAIMAVGGTTAALVPSEGGGFSIKRQMQVNVTADHRIIYGADVAEFLQTLAKIIEDPSELTL